MRANTIFSCAIPSSEVLALSVPVSGKTNDDPIYRKIKATFLVVLIGLFSNANAENFSWHNATSMKEISINEPTYNAACSAFLVALNALNNGQYWVLRTNIKQHGARVRDQFGPSIFDCGLSWSSNPNGPFTGIPGHYLYRQGNGCDAPKEPDGNGACTLKVDDDNNTSNQKSAGPACDSNTPNKSEGNPCNAGTGNKFQTEVDFTSTSLPFIRYYNSLFSSDGIIGNRWSHYYSASLSITSDTIVATRGNGKELIFTHPSGSWTADPDVFDRLKPVGTNWHYTTAENSSEIYNAEGQLMTIRALNGLEQSLSYNPDGTLNAVTNPFARVLTLGYENSRLATVTTPEGRVIHYSYAGSLLKSVIYPDDTPADNSDNPTRIYHYENTDYPEALTGITDENKVRYASWAYDTAGRARMSQHADGAERVDLVFNEDGTTTVTDALGKVKQYQFEIKHGIVKPTTVTENYTDRGTAQSISHAYTYTAAGQVETATDPNGTLTHYAYDDRGLLTQITAARDTAEQQITRYQWHPDYRVRSQIDRSGRRVQLDYDTCSTPTANHLCARTVTDTTTLASRTWTYRYTDDQDGVPAGLLKTIDGPRTDSEDLTTFHYYPNGDLWKIYNALGQVTEITGYDSNGRPTTILDRNQTPTVLDYDPRGRLKSRTVGNKTTHYAYHPNGTLQRVTQPSGEFLALGYDAAQRLISVSDAVGNRIEYQLDAMGNRIRETIKDPSGEIQRVLAREFNELGRLTLLIGGEGQLTRFAYDANGNLIARSDPRNTGSKLVAARLLDPLAMENATLMHYDPLNRLHTETHLQSLADVTDNSVTHYTYNALDQLEHVIDPEGAVTHYTYNALGDLIQLDSPDTGTTVYGYDQAGNRTTATDARNINLIYQYDGLNRMISMDYPGIDEDVLYRYDACQNGRGRLCLISDQSGTTAYDYDSDGNITEHRHSGQDLAYTTRYRYDNGKRIRTMTYPDGREVNYTYDRAGRLQQVTTTVQGTTRVIVDHRQIRADGGVIEQHFGNDLVEKRQYDLHGRLRHQTLDQIDGRSYHYDDNGNLITRTENDALVDYTYDGLDRLIDEQRFTTFESFSYDANGNRLSKNSEIYRYSPDSNRLEATDNNTRVLDPAGNTLSDRNTKRSFIYNQAGRLAQFFKNKRLKASYRYNAFGQRTSKVTQQKKGQRTLHYHYDLGGRLIAETRNGQPVRDYIWVGDQPAAQIRVKRTVKGKLVEKHTTYLTVDHLLTPRLGTDETGTVVWRWTSDAFGEARPDTDPDGDGKKRNIRLRFPGQYFDRETGLHYNWNRYYDPQIGRYISSDPIGLAGGLNTYGYVGQNPLFWIDPQGLIPPNWVRDNMSNGPAKGRLGVFGCLGACASFIEGDLDAQVSLQPTLGGGISICSDPKTENQSCESENEPETKMDCGIYDPNCDNQILPASSISPIGIGGFLLSVSFNVDGSFCVNIGPHAGLPLAPAVILGDFSE